MPSIANIHDVGSYITSAFGGAVSVTGGGSGDASEVSGGWVNRGVKKSAKVILTYTATLAEGETLTLASNVQDATDSSGTGAADYGDSDESYSSAVVATGGTGGSTETGTVEYDIDLAGANGYIQTQFTPTMSATTADTAVVAATIVLGGADEYPVS